VATPADTAVQVQTNPLAEIETTPGRSTVQTGATASGALELVVDKNPEAVMVDLPVIGSPTNKTLVCILIA
jgi:hypothetical protein